MNIAFSVLSWNVEKFGTKGDEHTARILDTVSTKTPDLVAFYETKPSAVWLPLMQQLDDYAWYITEGKQSQETLLGVKNDLNVFVTQRTEFKTRDAYYRPGLLCTVLVDDSVYPVLFLHLASLRDPKGFGRRQEQLDAAFDFKRTLDKSAPGASSNYMFVGDLNAMGLDFKYFQPASGQHYQRVRVAAEQELERLAWQADRHGMRLLKKSHDQTWRNAGGTRSDLDHVVAADHLQFTQQAGSDVLVEGWVNRPVAEQRDWLTRYSDHALLYFEVRKV